MILRDLNEIAARGAVLPLDFWLTDYQSHSRKILPRLKNIEPTIADKTIAKENLQQLIKLLGEKKPNAFILAKLLSYIAAIFTSSQPLEQKEFINAYLDNCSAFHKLAQQEEFYAQKRANIKKTMSLEEQQAYDLRLFKHEGMVYCLEFYLQLYKSIQGADMPEKKWSYINEKQINFGSGNLPGLREDFQSNESLQKFIYLILNDELREALTKEYFSARSVMISSNSLEQIIPAFKNFIQILISAFERIGINQLASFFFAPYGHQPLIKDIKL